MSARQPPAQSAVVSFVDLDDTLFRSPARGGHGRLAAVSRDGQPYSYMSPAQARLFEMLRRAGRVVPTTSRVPAQLARVRLPFDDWAICANGAVILDPAGRRDARWQAEVERRLARLGMQAPAVAELARAVPGGESLRIRLVQDDDRPLLVDVRSPDREAGPVERWAAALTPRLPDGWALDVARDRALIFPAAVDKAAAVEWFIEHHLSAPTLILGAGDRPSDRAFLARGHFAIVPTGSVLFEGLAGPEGMDREDDAFDAIADSHDHD